MIECILLLALLSLLIATDSEPGESGLPRQSPRRSFAGKSPPDQMEN
jgi:hypothetical protein